jgi:hypothetical protein
MLPPSCFDSPPTGEATSSAHELEVLDAPGVNDEVVASSFEAAGPVIRSAREPVAFGVSDISMIYLVVRVSSGNLKKEIEVWQGKICTALCSLRKGESNCASGMVVRPYGSRVEALTSCTGSVK